MRSACFMMVFCLSGVVVRPGACEEEITLRSESGQVTISTAGGGIVEFRFTDQATNPLNWRVTPELETQRPGEPTPKGHFLCLDRWGPPSDAEAANGVPFHGEAPRVIWQVDRNGSDGRTLSMSADLRLAGLRVKRLVSVDPQEAFFDVSEEVTNVNPRGRIFNMVQHPTIAPPFLSPETIVDSNARSGFWQQGNLPHSTAEAARWPRVSVRNELTDLRHFRGGSPDEIHSDVSSFVFDEAEEFGWITACNPDERLLIGYVWRTEDYPWLNIWRYMHQGQVAARGLEFGTTGYHQPFPTLVKVHRILDRQLYEFVDAKQTIRKRYAAFLFRIPADYRGVARVRVRGQELRVLEVGNDVPRANSLRVAKPILP